MKTFVAALVVASAAAAAVPDCSVANFAGLLPIAMDGNGVFATCSKDINEPVSAMMNPNWIPKNLQMVKDFAKSSNCKNFYKTVTNFMLTVKPPCMLHQAGADLSTDYAGTIPFDTSIQTWTAYYTPTSAPTPKPTDAPTAAPTVAPTPKPTDAPTAAPTVAPTPNPAC
ncbi:hypothetical protein SPRG_13213 [Saprolegnia parasitica CBS 223.65]|uniref:Secreted protein n=1 Tax=Saprolegnia parasitica (strain CBS 223.65) TaxID=695850 RepID=A0A067C3E7_SAPPC|nr:hypothetical protein SPRG_13213 [Saprolegnia parasitica CBS 223.65]KDO21322.1 hypothetical protein SPRG_13213 [Saprolegnia parasitica CBS 223.65]|eukprot:XP_012207977.1 hypothetical protein SPRG_13213 [Saprolegnia parasitica CBS 223.65]